MKSNEFPSVLSYPDRVVGATEKTPFRFEEGRQIDCPVRFEYLLRKDSAKIVVYPSDSPVKYLKLRFSADLTFVEQVLGDQWERAGVNAHIEWRSVMASRTLPWYCVVKGQEKIACYGVKTGANCFAFWQVDTHGVTLFLNLKSGEDGVDLREPLVACELVQSFAEGEDTYSVVQRFCRKMCEKPVLPKQPVFGVNNWYWAYGDITADTVRQETDYLMQLCSGTKHKPYMVIDDGWQSLHDPAHDYNGGPWSANGDFSDMQRLSEEIHAKGANSGLWFRPLLTKANAPRQAILSERAEGVLLDPTHPYTIDTVRQDVSRFRLWGYDLIKHDFTTMDVFGGMGLSADKHSYCLCGEPRSFYDKTKTTATAVKELYQTIQDAADGAEVISCNAFGHLAAGIHSMQRVGNDNSGHSFEWTRRDGINSMMRLPQNENFFVIDPDCAAFTPKANIQANIDFLKMCAITGATTFASVIPGFLSEKEMEQVNDIFKLADANALRYGIKHYEKNANPEIFCSPCGKEERFDWDKHFDGARIVLDWLD